jgi:hypothetical protein
MERIPAVLLAIGKRGYFVLRFEQTLEVALVGETRAVSDGGYTFRAIAEKVGGSLEPEVAEVISESPTRRLLEEKTKAAWAHARDARNFGL